MGHVVKHLFIILFVGACFILSTNNRVFGQFKSVKTDDLNLIYYNYGHQYLLNHTVRSYTNSLRFHEEKFNYNLTEPVSVIMSDYGDFANGGASAVPNNIILMGIAPYSYAYETNPANERINVLMNHELVHIIAQDKPNDSDRFFRKLFAGKVYPNRDNPVSMFYTYLTAPRIFAPRWYHEGIAEYMTTWMSGGIGRVMGAYDEMMFRTMVRDSSYIYDAVGLESEGTTADFQVGANSYMYGTRFMSYLSLQYGPQSLLDWVSRSDDSKAFYAGQFEKVYGNSLDAEWSNWIDWENDWQQKNLDRIRQNPITDREILTSRPLGGVSSGIYDEENNRIYMAVDLPGTVSHITSLNPDTGEMERITDIRGSALYFVSSLAYDPELGTLFYTNDNNEWRDLYSVNVENGDSKKLMEDVRTGDLVFDESDKSLWGIRHLNGISSIVLIPSPYSEWDRIYSMPYGEDIFDIDLSPDGKWMSAAIGNVSGDQRLVMLNTDSLKAGTFQPKELFDFEISSPSNFQFSDDGKYLFGSTYYSGVSNIVRYNIENEEIRWLTNVETGYFKPIPVSKDTLIAFEYRGTGFLPVKIKNEPVSNVSSINFLGQEIVENHPLVIDWMLPPPSADRIDAEALINERSDYSSFRNLSLVSAYPIVQGFKDYVAAGLRFNFSDDLRLHDLAITGSYTPYSGLSKDEYFHASFLYEMPHLRFFGNYNGSDFYDLFGPTKRSRKGYSIGVGYNAELYNDVEKTIDFDISTAYYGGMERLPDFQNITTSFSEFLALNSSISYRALQNSLGAVDYEKGFEWELISSNNFGDGKLFPRINQNFDFGFELPINHSSLWLRSSAGISFSPRREPLGNFYFGGFGNNWIDNQNSRQYRRFYSFPGAELNAIPATNFGKLMAEWATPPIRFKRAGFLNLYANWAQINFFSTGLITNIDDDFYRGRFYNVGAQLDIRMVIFSILESTFSVGYGSAWNYDTGDRGDEWMISLRLMR